MKPKLLLMIIVAVTCCLWVAATTAAHPASGIVVDRTGNVYFSDLETIWRFSVEGKLTVFRAGQRGRHVHELAIDEQDNIYGADISYNPATKGWPSNVWKINPAGEIFYLLETTENPPRGMSIWRDGAGSSYGHADGKGTAARFSSVGGITFGPDGSLYLTDGATIRKISMDGTVTTVGKGPDFREPADQPRFLSGLSGSLTGLSVGPDGAIYASDSANRRLLKVTEGGKVEAILRTQPPFFPNGVAVAGGNLYVLEVGLTLPNISSGPRVRKITADGKQTILTTVGARENRGERRALAERAGVTVEHALVLASGDGRLKYSVGLIGIGILSVVALIRQRRRRARA